MLDSFKLLDPAPHTPRITIDRLVVARETWRMTVGDSGLAGLKKEADRFLAVRRWRARLGLPERVFVKLGTEVKPCYVDLTGPLYAQSLCAMVDAAARTGPDVPIVVSELLPTPSDSWVTDASGRGYVSELRLQVTDPSSYPGGTGDRHPGHQRRTGRGTALAGRDDRRTGGRAGRPHAGRGGGAAVGQPTQLRRAAGPCRRGGRRAARAGRRSADPGGRVAPGDPSWSPPCWGCCWPAAAMCRWSRGPRRRLRGIAADAGVSLVVGDAAEAEFGDAPGVEAIALPGPAPLAPCPARPGDPAYVLFTSGSTGRPKGVLTSHRNVVEFVTGVVALSGAGADVRSLGIASLGFDAATMDLFVPLLLGGTVELLGAEDRADPVRLARFIAAHEVNWGFITPTVLAMLDPAELPGWRTVLCGGEAVPAALAARWAPGRRFLNGYGPTETTVLAVSGPLSATETDPVPIGRPLPNHRAYVVDAALDPVLPGRPVSC
ncbi:hypothetical protein GCM10027614_17790 [Micromonospora vulcania]